MKDIWPILSAPGSFFVIAGPCVIESEALCLEIAGYLKGVCERLSVPYIFKASFDKANRTSSHSFRGPGLEAGLATLAKVRREFDVPVLTDVHREDQAGPAAEVVDIIQIPAFLCRQTDLVTAAAKTGRIVNLKKGQYLAPDDMQYLVQKARDAGGERLLLTERGTAFGYHNLVVDMRSIAIMKKLGFPVVFDATHSVQLPGAGAGCSSGERMYAPVLAGAAVAAGADGVFVETHPEPERALSDGPNMIQLAEMPAVLERLLSIRQAAR
jgi:2-dehydro-3-deoxyphosphooctonate aldolase (KDO 8-P synthase)